jgi:hypothetical protein
MVPLDHTRGVGCATRAANNEQKRTWGSTNGATSATCGARATRLTTSQQTCEQATNWAMQRRDLSSSVEVRGSHPSLRNHCSGCRSIAPASPDTKKGRSSACASGFLPRVLQAAPQHPSRQACTGPWEEGGNTRLTSHPAAPPRQRCGECPANGTAHPAQTPLLPFPRCTHTVPPLMRRGACKLAQPTCTATHTCGHTDQQHSHKGEGEDTAQGRRPS